MSQEIKKSTEKALEDFAKEQENLEKLSFDTLNLSDMILNAAKKAGECLNEAEDKKEALLEAKECLNEVLLYTAQLSDTIHCSESAMAKHREALETIRMAVDFLCCDWDE